MAHTPGPWTVVDLGWLTAGVTVVDKNNHQIADVWQGNRDADLPCKANACLIAAAPELLEALQLYDRTYASTQKHPSVTDEAHCISVIRTAIAKAIGD